MYTLLIVHSLSILFFTWKSVRFQLKSSEEEPSTTRTANEDDSSHDHHWRKQWLILFVQVILPLVLQTVGTLLPFASVGWALVWLVYVLCLLWFNFFSPPAIRHGRETFWCCRNTHTSCLHVFCSCLMKTKSNKRDLDSTQRFVSFKFFVIISIIGMSTVLAFIYRSNDSLSGSLKALLIIGIIIMCKFV